MQQVNIHEAKTHLSRLLEQVSAGEQIIISKAGKPIAKLIPFKAAVARKRIPGLMKGKIFIRSDFDDPLPEDLLALFEGRDEDFACSVKPSLISSRSFRSIAHRPMHRGNSTTIDP